jgi:hypothetical protein
MCLRLFTLSLLTIGLTLAVPVRPATALVIPFTWTSTFIGPRASDLSFSTVGILTLNLGGAISGLTEVDVFAGQAFGSVGSGGSGGVTVYVQTALDSFTYHRSVFDDCLSIGCPPASSTGHVTISDDVRTIEVFYSGNALRAVPDVGEIDISLPDGLFITPLPAGLPLFVTGLGLLGIIVRRKRT